LSSNFDAILAEYGPLLSRVASSYEANPALREELTQDIALAVWQSLARFAGSCSIKTYILKVAHNRAVSHVAKHAKAPALENIDQHDFPHRAEGCMADLYEQDRKRQYLLDAVRTLPLQSRQVLTLSLEGVSYDDIAQICGLTRTHVGVLLNRAKTAIQRSLEHV